MSKLRLIAAVTVIASLIVVGIPKIAEVAPGTYSGIFTQSVTTRGDALCLGSPAFSVENIEITESPEGISLGDLDLRLPRRKSLSYRGMSEIEPISGGRSRLRIQVTKASEGFRVSYTERLNLGNSNACIFKTTGIITPS